MSIAADPQAVFEAIKDSREEMLTMAGDEDPPTPLNLPSTTEPPARSP